ncbi:MAG TPA: hypothetical protein DCM40_19665 [Maribacter sp.]|nr:hypothetical protein [Maribacter sp.]
MASNIAFSSKEFQVAIKGETTAGSAVTTGLLALDVDSISMPSLNVTQALEVRGGGSGRTFKNQDFFQDNILRTTEISVSGRFHDDEAHRGLFGNITGTDGAGASPAVASGYSPDPLRYEQTSLTAADYDTFTLYVVAPSTSNAKHIQMPGCVVSNITLSGDVTADGGLIKYSATIVTGQKPNFANTTDLSSAITAYTNGSVRKMSSATETQVKNADVALQSFTTTIDNPVVFTGADNDGSGFEVINRGAECSVTTDFQIKYDANTDEFISDFDTQGATPTIMDADAFKITAAGSHGVNIQNGVFTNMSLSEGDIMMLDGSIKATDDGTDALVAFTF